MTKLNKIVIGAGLLLGFVTAPVTATAQSIEPWTGSIPGDNIDFSQGETLKKIRSLINRGDTEDAVRISQRFVDRLTSGRTGSTNSVLYDAYNALCISLTSNKQYDDAMKACEAAINMTPNRWQAVNSRGSLNFRTGKYTEALSDYQNALKMAPDRNSDISAVLEHNIKISQSKLNSN
mgnify:FL=1